MKLADFLRRLHQRQAGIVNQIVGLVIGGLVVAWLLPLAITTLVGVNTSGWTEPLASMWPYIPAVIGIAVLLLFLGYVKFGSGSKE